MRPSSSRLGWRLGSVGWASKPDEHQELPVSNLREGGRAALLHPPKRSVEQNGATSKRGEGSQVNLN